MNPMQMGGRNVLITGAAQGIGLSAARLLGALGANLTLVDMNAEALAAAAASFPADKVLAIAGSVTDRAFVADMVAQSAARFGGVHGLVNNAGITRTAMIHQMTAESWQAVIDVNLTGCYLMMQAVGRHMVDRAKGEMPQPAGTTGGITTRR